MKKILTSIFDDTLNGSCYRYLIVLSLWGLGFILNHHDISHLAGIAGIHLWLMQSMRLSDSRKESYTRFVELEKLKEDLIKNYVRKAELIRTK